MPSIAHAFKALRELGPRQVGLYLAYQLGLRIGYFRWRTRFAKLDNFRLEANRCWSLPDKQDLKQMLGADHQQLCAQADEIVAGQVRLFGGDPVSLELDVPGSPRHWTQYKKSCIHGRDIKWIWEPARFGWVYPLGRAFYLTGDDRYASAFWNYAEFFFAANPPYRGPNWVSGQEVGLRLIALLFADVVFSTSTLKNGKEPGIDISALISAHAARIPPTLIYARSQNNNHLIVESLALYAAGLAFPTHPDSPAWQAMGWRCLHRGLRTQIEPDGSYMQQSNNYHRLVLQIGLLAHSLARKNNRPFPQQSRQRLAAATRWLLSLLDSHHGHVPNLGPNDGAYILPLSEGSFYDYRPVLQAASLAFLGAPAFKPGHWDEMARWFDLDDSKTRLGSSVQGSHPSAGSLPSPVPAVLHHPEFDSWLYLRAAHFTHRPGHADQLHLDLWWRGLNLACDPGTYLYNAPPPWNNALTVAHVHNTITVNGEDQMTRASRFLYVDRAQAHLFQRTASRLVAEHDGYQHFGITHRRAVEVSQSGWFVTDELLPVEGMQLGAFKTGKLKEQDGLPTFNFRLNWLLPDWHWNLQTSNEEAQLAVQSPHGWVKLNINMQATPLNPDVSGAETSLVRTPQSIAHPPARLLVFLFRAGTTLHGDLPADPIWGWCSPTYGYKEPALSFAVEVQSPLPLTMFSSWTFPSHLPSSVEKITDEDQPVS